MSTRRSGLFASAIFAVCMYAGSILPSEASSIGNAVWFAQPDAVMTDVQRHHRPHVRPHPGYRPRPGYRPGYRPPPRRWVRPGRYYWRPGAAVAAGAALGFIGAATAAAWAGPAPASGMCWYYTDRSRRQGFWDYCP